MKHLKIGYQELYEVSLHNNWETAKVVEMKQLKAEVKRQMALEGDYKVCDPVYAVTLTVRTQRETSGKAEEF